MAADWIECRQLRNFKIHEYARDMAVLYGSIGKFPVVLAAALRKGHLAVPMLAASARTLAGLVLAAVPRHEDATGDGN